MNDPRFVIGIGSQRAGSTLLHRILNECTSVFMHPVKELHYFDTLFGVRDPEVLVAYSQAQIDRELDRLIRTDDHGYVGDKRFKCYLRTNKILSRQSIDSVDYLDLYNPCLTEDRRIGEITPEYMILPENGVKFLAECVGRDAAIVLLARDPVNRFISSFKLLKTYRSDSTIEENFDEELRRVLDEMPDWIEQQRQLNDFEAALNNYKKFFDNICFIRFEDLIENETAILDKLETSIESSIDRERATQILAQKVNQIDETGDVSPQTLDLLADFFRSESDYLNGIKNNRP